MTPTTAKCGIYTYMIRDAQLGLLGSIPLRNFCTKRPRSALLFGRQVAFIVGHNVPSKLRRGVQARLMDSIGNVLMALGLFDRAEPLLVEALAELKLIRTMETRIKSTTDRYSGLLESGQTTVDDVMPLLQDLSERQNRLYRITRDLVLKRNK